MMIHGVLTHLFNDYTDFLTGTDAHSPAVLSGGSRVIQKGMIRPQIAWQLEKWLAIALLAIAVLMAIAGKYELTILIIVGVWAAASYSLPPFRFSYRPFLGEWLSLFPAIFSLGIAGPWIILESIPLWAFQNAVINAFVCMGWVMVHHIPDVEADRKAVPAKRTSVVWFADKLGTEFTRFPAFLYLFMAGLCTIWMGADRKLAALVVSGILLFALFLVATMNPKNLQQVTKYEKILLLLAIVIAVVLGVFV